MKDLPIIDGHCHLASMHCIPEEFLRGVASNLESRAKAYGNRIATAASLVDVLSRQHQDHDGELLLKEMDAAGIVRSVLLFADFGVSMSGAPEPEAAFERHVRVCRKHVGRFYFFPGIDPRRERALERFESWLPSGMVNGLKLYPACGYSASADELYPFYELCAAHRLPVLFHSGPTVPNLLFEHTAPNEIDRAARDFPGVNFVIGHGAVHNVEQSSLLCAYRPNVYMDTASFINTIDPRGWKAQLASVFASRLNHKVIFASDWPVARKLGGLQLLMDEFLGRDGPLADVSRGDAELILGGNLLRIVGT